MLVGLPAAAQSREKPTKQQCVAANESAQDLQNAGKLRDAAAQLETCTNKACPGAVREDCADRLRQVEAAIPTVVFLLRDTDGLDVGPSAVAEMDGAPWPAVLDGTPVAVDPGDHVFTFKVAGRQPATRRIALRAGERLRRDVQLKAEAAAESSHGAGPGAGEPAPAPPAADVGAAPRPEAAPEPAASQTGHVGWSRAAGYAALGAGGGGLVLSAIFGAVALSQKADLTGACPDHTCPPSKQSENDAFKNNLVAGNVALIAGVVGIVTGVALLWLVPQDRPATAGALSVSPWVGVGSAGVGGTFR
jgi:hypothetical protein